MDRPGGGLDNVDVLAAHAFVKFDEQIIIGVKGYIAAAERHIQVAGDLGGQLWRPITGEQFDLAV
jgi:hypothetical protein